MKPKARPISKSLSKNVLQMKFMKKSALETQEMIAENEKNKLIDNEHWYLSIEKLEINQNKINVEKSYSIFNDFTYGRLSFQGFNPEIEKIMQNKQGIKAEEEVDEISAEDKELAEYYQKNYNRTTKKRKRDNKNFDLKNAIANGNLKEKFRKSEEKMRKFIKPNLDD